VADIPQGDNILFFVPEDQVTRELRRVCFFWDRMTREDQWDSYQQYRDAPPGKLEWDFNEAMRRFRRGEYPRPVSS
jgi:hypothetical protein